MTIQILEGVLERKGPGQVLNGQTLVEYIDIGGRRISKVAWLTDMGYQIDKALGKPVRLATSKLGAAAVVAAIDVDGQVIKEGEDLKVPAYSQMELSFFAFLLAALGLAGIVGALQAGQLIGIPIGALFLWPAVAMYRRARRFEAGFRDAKNALDA